MARQFAPILLSVWQDDDFKTPSGHRRFKFNRTHAHRGLREVVYNRDDFTCQHCGRRGLPTLPYYGAEVVWLDGGVDYLTIDHITPVTRGGSVDDPANLQTLCQPCNCRKGAKV